MAFATIVTRPARGEAEWITKIRWMLPRVLLLLLQDSRQEHVIAFLNCFDVFPALDDHARSLVTQNGWEIDRQSAFCDSDVTGQSNALQKLKERMLRQLFEVHAHVWQIPVAATCRS